MQLKALANLSGPFGRVVVDEEFTVEAAVGADLVQRKIAVEVKPALSKPVKAPVEAG